MNQYSTPIFLPKPPENYVKRPILFTDIFDKLYYKNSRLIGLHGPPGYGKSTLAQSICTDERLQNKFKDGIYWITLGKSPILINSISKLFVEITGIRESFIDIEDASFQLENVISEKEILIIIDDLWQRISLNPFLRGGENCTRLITTRNLFSLPNETDLIPVDKMTEPEAIRVLTSNIDVSAENISEAANLTKRMCYWPLLLNLANSVLRRRLIIFSSFSKTVKFLNDSLDSKGFTAFDFRNAEDRNHAVSITMQLSLDELSEFERYRFNELGIFIEDISIPINIIFNYWEKTSNMDEVSTTQLLLEFYDLSLLQRINLDLGSIVIHDVMTNFMRTNLEHEISRYHSILADTLINTNEKDRTNNYSWEYLFFHLSNAGMKEKIEKYSINYRWIKNKLFNTSISSLLSDLSISNTKQTKLIRKSIEISAHIISNDKEQIPTQLWGRLSGIPDGKIEDLLRNIEKEDKLVWLQSKTKSLTPPGGPLVRTLRGHTNIITSLVHNKATDFIFSGDNSGIVIGWDFGNGIEKLRFDSGFQKINSLFFLTDTLLVISGESKITLVDIRDLKNWRTVKTISPINDIEICSVTKLDENHVIVGFNNGTIQIINIFLDKIISEFPVNNHEITALIAITIDGNRCLVSGAKNGDIQITNIQLSKTFFLYKHKQTVNDLKYYEERNLLFSASNDNTIIEWDLFKKKINKIYNGHTKGVTSITLFDNKFLISASIDKNIRVWDLEGEEAVIFPGHSREINTVISVDNYLISGSADNTIKIWDLKNSQSINQTSVHSNWIWSVKFWTNDKNELNIVSGAADRHIKIFNFDPYLETNSFLAHSAPINAIAVSQSKKMLLSGSLDNKFKVWDLITKNLLFTSDEHNDWVFGVAFSPDENYAGSVSRDGLLCVWNTNDWSLRSKINCPCEINSLAFSPDNKYMFGACWDKTIKVWDFESNELEFLLKGHEDLVVHVAIIPRTSKIISASYDHSVKVWDYKERRLVASLDDHLDKVNEVAVNANGTRAISASHDHSGIVWDLRTYKKIATFSGDSTFRSCDISQDGNQFVLGSTLGRLHLLELRNYE